VANSVKKYFPFFVSALLMCIVLAVIYPHYQYYIDPDGTAYLTISKRYAAGDFAKAINGYWSPWSCWLTAALIKTGLTAIPASVIINAAGAIGFLLVAQSFFLKFEVIGQIQWMLNITLAFFLCYAIFWQSFDDLWECFFLLAALRLMLMEKFADTPMLWAIYGITGALAYFAKAYSFPFLIVNTLLSGWFVIPDRKKMIWMYALSIGVFLSVAAPWIIALHSKYGIWTTSTAGSLNTSWYLVGHPYWKEGIDLLIPPAYKDSPYYWEDPYLANGITPHFWSSWHLFGRQFLVIGHNAWKYIVSMMLITFCSPVIMYIYLKKTTRHLLSKSTEPIEHIHYGYIILCISLLLFPLGYLPINFEPRYLWYVIPILMTLGVVSNQYIKKPLTRFIVFVLFPISFLIYPIRCMSKMYDAGKDDYKIAMQLQQLNIRGSFASTAKPGIEAQAAERIAYFSGTQFYSLSRQSFTQKEMLKEIRRYRINYFLVFDKSVLTDEYGKPFPELAVHGIEGLRAYLVNP
jgi:hypothetical protein